MNNDFNNIITSLQTLQTIVPDAAFKKRMEQTVFPNKTHTNSLILIFSLRMALIFLSLLFIGSASIISSKPGEFLYPIKKAFTNTTIHFASKPVQKTLGEKPTTHPTPLPTIIPLLHTEKTQDQSFSNTQPANDVTSTPIQTAPLTITPTPSTTIQTHDSSTVDSNVQISSTPVALNISTESNSPSNNRGSTDNKDTSLVKNTTSLLPAVKINIGL